MRRLEGDVSEPMTPERKMQIDKALLGGMTRENPWTMVGELFAALEHAERALTETHVLLGGALEALATEGVVRLDQSVRQQIIDLRTHLAEAEQRRVTDARVYEGLLGHAVAEGTPTVLSDGSRPLENVLAITLRANLAEAEQAEHNLHELHAAIVERLEAAEQRGRAQDWKWICEFCYARLYVNTLPKSWEWIWQSAVCPECRPRVQQDGGYDVVKGGAYAEVPDPRAVTPGARSAPPPGA